MTSKGLQAFEDALRTDEALLARYQELLEGVTEASSDGEAIQMVAAQLGFDVPLEELERAWAAAQEVDEAELETVAGGIPPGEDEYKHDNWCITIWHCYAATLHTDTISMDVTCWSDYECIKWWNPK